MRFGSVFTGIGGWDLGMERAGHECLWQIENDRFANRVLEKAWPHVRRFGDVCGVDVGHLERVDLVVGSPPCQDLSDAATTGEREGLSGTRSGLFSEFMRIVEGVRPRWVAVENVDSRIHWVPAVRAMFARIGFASVPMELCAGSFGASHVRTRRIVVAHADREGELLGSLYEQVALVRPPPVPDGGWRTPASVVLRVGHGVPNLLDRCRVLGNAVHVDVAEWLGRQIRELDRR